MTAATWFDHEDYWNGIYTNDCGIKAGHAYSLISAFELKDTNGTVTEQLYMLRNPNSYQSIKGKWSGNFCNDADDKGTITDQYGDTCDWYSSNFN
jgi:hypothetical protein